MRKKLTFDITEELETEMKKGCMIMQQSKAGYARYCIAKLTKELLEND